MNKDRKKLLDLVVRGRLNKQIAFEFDINEEQAKKRVNRLLHDFGVHNRTELAYLVLTGEKP